MLAGSSAKAEPFLQRALDIDLRTLGPSHTETAKCMALLGTVYADLGYYSHAESLLKQAVDICTKAPGAQEPTDVVPSTVEFEGPTPVIQVGPMVSGWPRFLLRSRLALAGLAR